MVFDAAAFWVARRSGGDNARAALRAVAGPALAMLLLAVGGGALTRTLTDGGGSGLSLGWIDDLGSRRPLGSFSEQPGGLGLLGLGPFLVAGAAALLALRDRLVVALAAGAIVFLLAALMLQYEYSPDVVRLDGHARNFALLALLLALSIRLACLRSRWRYAVSVLLAGMVIWPTVVGPARNLGLAVGQGTQLANAQAGQRKFGGGPMNRSKIKRFASEPIVAYIRDHTAIDARILSPNPIPMSIATGRPNAVGFAGLTHLHYYSGPDYADARRFLEPTAIRRLGFEYVYMPDTWRVALPARAKRWLADPALFEPLVRDSDATLYRVQSAFLKLDTPPAPGSFAHLRSSVPPSTTVYLPTQLPWLTRLRVASVLPHARLLGTTVGTVREWLHLRTPEPWTAVPLGEQMPDLVVLPASIDPWMIAPAGRLPVWHNDEIAVYAPNGAVAPIMPPPPRPDPPDFGVRLSDVRAADGHITFAATFDNRSPEQWTGQDWVVIAVDDSPWNLPLAFGPDGRTPVAAAWLDGWLGPSVKTTTHTYEFDALASQLAIRNSHGVFTAAESSGGVQGAGVWALAVRLRHEWRPNSWRDAAYLPVLRITVSDTGEVSYSVFADVRDGTSLP